MELWAIAWTNIKSHTDTESHSILASGSNTGELQLYHPKKQVSLAFVELYPLHHLFASKVYFAPEVSNPLGS